MSKPAQIPCERRTRTRIDAREAGGLVPQDVLEFSLFTFAILVLAHPLMADQVAVRHLEGRIHGFLVLRDLDDNILASGGLTQLANGNRVTTELIFHFKDGSSHEETAVFSQRRTFQLLTYHLVQKGRAFKHETDMSLNAATGQVTVHYADDEGKPK